MPRKKTPFIDKKTADRFTLVFVSDGESSDDEPDRAGDAGAGPSGSGGGSGLGLAPASQVGKHTVRGQHGGNGGGGDAGAGGPPIPPHMLAPPWWAGMGGGGESQLGESKRREIVELGLPDDGYDYTKHMRKMHTQVPMGAAPDSQVVQDAAVEGGAVAFVPAKEVNNQLEADKKVYDARGRAIEGAKPSKAMEAIFDEVGSQAGSDVGELEDDFVAMALAGGPAPGEEDVDEEEELMRALGLTKRKDDEDDDYDDDYAALEGEATERAERSAALQIMEEQFAALEAEYDDDDIGELDEDDAAVRGDKTLEDFAELLEGGGLLEVKRDEYDPSLGETLKWGVKYEQNVESDLKVRASCGRRAAGQCPRLPGVMRLVTLQVPTPRGLTCFLPGRALALCACARVHACPQAKIAALAEKADEAPAPTDTELAPVRAFREHWDCETIVSTYTNTENHPSVIDLAPADRQPKMVGDAGTKGARAALPGVLRLDARGMPIMSDGSGAAGVRRGRIERIDEGDDEEGEAGEPKSLNKSHKGESAEEKKARKAAVKAAQREARALKKEYKNAFKKESARQNKSRSNQGSASTTVL